MSLEEIGMVKRRLQRGENQYAIFSPRCKNRPIISGGLSRVPGSSSDVSILLLIGYISVGPLSFPEVDRVAPTVRVLGFSF